MLRKQNRNPNKADSLLSKGINKSQVNNSITPDTSTSRIAYKPKYIKKPIANSKPTDKPSQIYLNQLYTLQQSQTYINSPASITENNTIDLEGFNGNKIRYRQLYFSTKKEMESRTQKFNKSINLFCYILKDLKNAIHDQRLTAPQKLEETDLKIDYLLDAFSQFEHGPNC